MFGGKAAPPSVIVPPTKLVKLYVVPAGAGVDEKPEAKSRPSEFEPVAVAPCKFPVMVTDVVFEAVALADITSVVPPFVTERTVVAAGIPVPLIVDPAQRVEPILERVIVGLPVVVVAVTVEVPCVMTVLPTKHASGTATGPMILVLPATVPS